MRVEVDARGLACPKPVIHTKKELEKISDGVVVTTVDNKMAKENLLKLAKSLNLESNIVKDEEELITIEIVKNGEICEIADAIVEEKDDLENRCIFITKDKMGSGNDELGEVLIKGFVYTLTETKPYPKSILLVNGGIKLSTVNEDTVGNLKILEEAGVEVLSCGTCLDYYDLKDELKVGTVTNMYSIVESLKNSSNTITI
ncbi:sulfurtransferase-like selenium metabolism protein YedF [Clostridioides mangenotii]|uniref:sulfurtransferase-like selenium metabolism protein YedF n=1 Tax=Metaclostridioides mangenotii TaxID=1540 RepID=UPI001C0F4AD6|nr:sulfurtransferase-like selenium metabolism protein YedF [Clostridioides mangenotii]MBU5308675.1 sulfurtransferase-like selenium metabolism protein YedF [Clostridioides mangenotii]MCR1955923.1 sulfurtransferase-like selenium metabolism protein YedF [Clostridioides mangenotii]